MQCFFPLQETQLGARGFFKSLKIYFLKNIWTILKTNNVIFYNFENHQQNNVEPDLWSTCNSTVQQQQNIDAWSPQCDDNLLHLKALFKELCGFFFNTKEALRFQGVSQDTRLCSTRTGICSYMCVSCCNGEILATRSATQTGNRILPLLGTRGIQMERRTKNVERLKMRKLEMVERESFSLSSWLLSLCTSFHSLAEKEKRKTNTV